MAKQETEIFQLGREAGFPALVSFVDQRPIVAEGEDAWTLFAATATNGDAIDVRHELSARDARLQREADDDARREKRRHDAAVEAGEELPTAEEARLGAEARADAERQQREWVEGRGERMEGLLGRIATAVEALKK